MNKGGRGGREGGREEGSWGDGVVSLFFPSFFLIFVCEGQVLFMLLVIQKGGREAGLEKVGQGNERAVYVYEERKKRRKRKR